MDDKELVRQIQMGNPDCADALVERYYSQVLRYCAWHCRHVATAEDLTQETFFRLFRDICHYRNDGKFKSYLYTIAYHLCIDEARKPAFAELPEDLAAGDAELRRIEDRDELRALLSQLSPPQKEAVILHFGEQLSFREIAEITGVPARTIQSRVRLALAILRKERGNEKK